MHDSAVGLAIFSNTAFVACLHQIFHVINRKPEIDTDAKGTCLSEASREQQTNEELI
jgi:hypothetical protein